MAAEARPREVTLDTGAPTDAGWATRVTAALAESETRLRLAQEAAGIGVWEFDCSAGTMAWSPEQYRLHGLDPDDGPPTFERWLALVDPEDQAAILAIQAAMQEPGAGALRLEFRIRRPSDGARRRLASLGRLISDEAGHPSRIVGVNLDVTDQRRALDDLQRTTALLRAIGACSPDPIYAKDAEGRFLFANPAVLAVIGRSADEVIGRTDADFHHDPAQAAAVMANDRRIIEGGQAEVLEESFDAAGRGRRVFRSAKAPLRADDGTALGLVAISSDITHVKQAEAALRQSEERFRATFEQAAVGMSHNDLDGAWIRVNDRLCDMLGYTRVELLAVTFRDVTHPDDLAADLDLFHRCLAGEISSYVLEKRYIHKDGSELWGTLTVSLVRDQAGAPQYFIAVVEDISQRKRTELRLRQSEERFRRLFDGAPLPSYLVDPLDGSVVDCNDAAATMLGYHRHEICQMRVADIDTGVQGEDIRAAKPVLAGSSTQFEGTHRTRCGDVRDVAIAAVPVDIGGRRLAHCTVVDITERKRAETELRRLTADLEARVREEVAARETAQARAAQAERMHALGQLAGGIAHDFNNVLQAVHGSGSMIARRATEVEAVRRYARILVEAADRGASITRRLLAFARRGDLRAVPIEPAGILEGMRDILAPTLGAAITIAVDARSGLPMVLADRSQLETALVNLAANARDAMPRGGTLTLAAATEVVAPGNVHRANLAAGSYVCLSVADTGEGIQPDVLARLFQPFFTTKAPGRGTGLGLAMVKGFAEQSGGGVAVESTPGLGTQVKLWLPQAAEAATDGAAGDSVNADGAASDASRTRVLVVDDDALVLETVAAQLEDAGFAVTTAGGGLQALALLDEGMVADAMVSDLSMPGMDGVTLIQEAQARQPAMAAILLTGYAGDSVSLAVGRRVKGPFALMRKPSSGSELADRISALLADPGGGAAR
jgi:PAS domain S-box-containing protein